MEIYADNAATTKMSRAAMEVMLPYMDQIYGNPSSVHAAGRKAAEAVSRARRSIAALLGCEARELTFTSGGSESDNQAIRSAAAMGKRRGKTHIISTKFEHHAVLNTLKRLEEEGFDVTLLDVSPEGIVAAEDVERAIRPETCLVTVMYANNEVGTVQPIAEIGILWRSDLTSRRKP